jgi:ribosome biogenesis GTPase
VNKTDLAQDMAACHEAIEPYQQLGYQVILTSALTGKGVARLKDTVRAKTSVLAGLSGVGKSSLLNAIQPGLQLRIGVVSDHSHSGRHTTTQVNLLKLDIGGYVVDTPGIREFGLSGLRRNDLVRFYPEIAAAESGCRFADCSHTHEPGCAVKAAVQQGQLSRVRYHSYTQIYPTLPESHSRQKEQAQARTRRR